MENDIKPPIGLRPRHIAEMDRLREVMEAIERYYDAGYLIPPEWDMELRELITSVAVHRKLFIEDLQNLKSKIYGELVDGFGE